MRNTVYTIGYGGMEGAAELAQVCRDTGAVLLDVRYSPYSRNEAFTGRTIRLAVPRYEHVPQLGNRNYKEHDAPIDIADPRLGLAIAENYLERGPILLLCYCPHVSVCHRKTVADMLAERGYPVIHLSRQRKQKPQGGTESKQGMLF